MDSIPYDSQRGIIRSDDNKNPVSRMVTGLYLVEAGGIEPTVRENDHKSFSERRLLFGFATQAPAVGLLGNYLDKSYFNPPRIGLKPAR